MTLFHLSHIDLDGYGCQYVTNHFFDSKVYSNSNYGNEIQVRLGHIAAQIAACGDPDILWLVTDLNLTTQQCNFMENKKNELVEAGQNVQILLLDHHSTGKDQAAQFPWYNLDNDRCATKITFDYFTERFAHLELSPLVGKMVDNINAIDLWKEETTEFEFGKSAMRLIIESKEINKMLFPYRNVEYKIAMIHEASLLLEDETNLATRHIELDDAIHFMRKNYLRGEKPNDTLDNLASDYVVALLTEQKEDLSITYKGYKGILTYSVGNISVVGNDFLALNEEFDFILDVSTRGSVSLRSSNRANVAQISKELFDGGGHVNAAGGKLPAYKEFYDYRDVKAHIEAHIKSKS